MLTEHNCYLALLRKRNKKWWRKSATLWVNKSKGKEQKIAIFRQIVVNFRERSWVLKSSFLLKNSLKIENFQPLFKSCMVFQPVPQWMTLVISHF